MSEPTQEKGSKEPKSDLIERSFVSSCKVKLEKQAAYLRLQCQKKKKLYSNDNGNHWMVLDRILADLHFIKNILIVV